MRHTPGPWETHVEHDVSGYPVFCIHGFSGDQKRDMQTLEANAKLIAAAPDMLALLQELIDIEGPQPGHGFWANRVEAVIAKATL